MTTVSRTCRIAAPPDRVWAVVREFAGLDRWVPTLPGPAEVVGDPAVPGAERVFRRDGATIAVERLVRLDDVGRVTSYSIVRSAAPMDDHLATLSVRADDDGTTVEWTATFTADGEAAGHIASAMARHTFEPGLQRLAELCEDEHRP